MVMPGNYYAGRMVYSTARTVPSGTGSRRMIQARSSVRRRGPAPILIIAAVVAAAVFLWVFGKGCGGAQQARENDMLETYTNTVDNLNQRSAAAAQSFNNVANSVRSFPHSEVDTRLAQIENECKALLEESTTVKPPTGITELQPLLKLGYDLRVQGVQEYHAGIMGVLNRTDRNAAAQAISKGLEDLVVSDQVLGRYRASLAEKLKAAKSAKEPVDPGRFVASVDCASSASVTAYIATIIGPTATTRGSSSPAEAMKAYLKSKGIDYSSMSFSVVSESESSPSWKVDVASEEGGKPTYFLLHNVNGWTVVASGSTLTAAQMKSAGAPNDLAAPAPQTSPQTSE